MKQATPQKRIFHKEKEHSALQVREYMERYRPELTDSAVDISPCGMFASVRGVQRRDQP